MKHTTMTTLVFVILAGKTAAQTPNPATTLKRIVNALAEEAEAALESGAVTATEPDFASRWDGATPIELIEQAILRKQHDEPFVDAYIRWQLTSFAIEFPDVTDAAFAQFMNHAPPLLENPKADGRLVSMLEQTEAGPPLAPARVAELKQLMEQVNEREMVVDHLNHPAAAFREWVAEQLGDRGIRPRLWMVETLAARIIAGWSVRDIKGDLTREFTESIEDESFTRDERRTLLLELSRLVGPGRRWLNQITYYANGRINVVISTSQVTEANVDQWRQRLYGIGD